MKQVLIIHGGNSFDSYSAYRKYLDDKVIRYEDIVYTAGWKDWLANRLPNADVLTPNMPNGQNAVYEEWVIYFEKILPYLKDNATLVGHSLGAMFLAKYLNEKPLVSPVKQLVLIAGAYDNEINEDLGSFRVVSTANVPASAKEVHLFHSEDDPVVPYTELAKFEHDMPSAVVHSFTNKGHFFGRTPTFPELLEIIKSHKNK